MDVIVQMGYADSVASHVFENGVVAVQLRGELWATDIRISLCNTLVDEFRDSVAVKEIVITQVEPSPLSSTSKSQPVRWDRPDLECVADRI